MGWLVAGWLHVLKTSDFSRTASEQFDAVSSMVCYKIIVGVLSI